MTIKKCVFPGCGVTGEGLAGRVYACELHTRWIVAGYQGVRSGLKSLAVEVAKQEVKKVPWWAKAFLKGMTDAS